MKIFFNPFIVNSCVRHVFRRALIFSLVSIHDTTITFPEPGKSKESTEDVQYTYLPHIQLINLPTNVSHLPKYIPVVLIADCLADY